MDPARGQDCGDPFYLSIPFVWIHYLSQPQVHSMAPLLRQVSLISNLQCSLKSSEKEYLTASVIALRIYYLLELDPGATAICASKLFPGASPRKLELPCQPELVNWTVAESSQQLTKDMFESLIDKKQVPDSIGLDSIVTVNCPHTEFSDTIVWTVPRVFVQDKLLQQMKPFLQTGRGRKFYAKQELFDGEHEKCSTADAHFFVLVTDALAANIEVASNEMVISSDNEAQFFGKFLAMCKLFRDRTNDCPQIAPLVTMFAPTSEEKRTPKMATKRKVDQAVEGRQGTSKKPRRSLDHSAQSTRSIAAVKQAAVRTHWTRSTRSSHQETAVNTPSR